MHLRSLPMLAKLRKNLCYGKMTMQIFFCFFTFFFFLTLIFCCQMVKYFYIFHFVRGNGKFCRYENNF